MSTKATLLISTLLGLGVAGLCCLVGVVFVAIVFPISMDVEQNQIQATCKVEYNEILEHTCHRSCNCHRQCSGSTNSRSCHTYCSTCPYTCYDGLVHYELELEDGTYRTTQRRYSEVESYTTVRNGLNKCCEPGSPVTCYYDKRNPNKIQFDKEVPGLWAGLSFLFFGFAILAICCCCVVNIVAVLMGRSSITNTVFKEEEQPQVDNE